MKKVTAVVALAAMVLMLVGCAAHTHVVGDGAQTGAKEELRQWYVLWGLVPINEVNTDEMVGDADDYVIKTEQSALDVVINIFTSWVTVYSRTVTVTK